VTVLYDDFSRIACCASTVPQILCYDVTQARVKVHAIVTSYEVAMMEATELRKLEFEALVVDEGHRLKNSSSRCTAGQRSQTCLREHMQWKSLSPP